MGRAYLYMEGDRLKILREIPKEQLERRYGPLTDEQHEALTLKHLTLEQRNSLKQIDESLIPNEDQRQYRNAWELSNDTIATNLSKKAEIDDEFSAAQKRQDAIESLIKEKMESTK